MKSVILLGAGYSVLEGINSGLWNKIQGQEIWSLNSCFIAMPAYGCNYLPSKELFVDRDFWSHNADALEKLYSKNIPIITRDMGKMLSNRPELIKYHTTRVRADFNGLNGIKNNLIYSGNMGLVGIFALHLALCMDYDVIYLLGYDFGSAHLDEKRTHWYQDRIVELNIQSYGAARPEVYLHKDPGHVNEIRKDIEDFELFKNLGKTIYNVSPNSHIKYFEKIDYSTMFQKLGV